MEVERGERCRAPPQPGELHLQSSTVPQALLHGRAPLGIPRHLLMHETIAVYGLWLAR